MDAFSLVVGVAAGIMIGIILASLRRTPRLGGSPVPRAAALPDASPDPAGIVASRDDDGHLHLTRRIVRHEARAVVGPNGVTFEMDGKTYDSVDDIPDPTTRENLRSLLAQAPSRVGDPDARDRLVDELHVAGVEAQPAPPTAASASNPVDAAGSPPPPDAEAPPQA